MCTVLRMGVFNNLRYLRLILKSTAKGMKSDGRSSQVLSSYVYCGFNSVVVSTVVTHMEIQEFQVNTGDFGVL